MKSRFPVRAYIAALLMSAGIFFLVSCSQNESENGKKYSQADNVSVSADPGQTPASTPGEKIPPPQNAEVATPAKVATTGQTPADPVETGMNMIYDKLAKLNDKQFKQFADEHHGIPGVSYIQGADGKMLRSIENPANKPQEQEPMTIGQYNAQTQR